MYFGIVLRNSTELHITYDLQFLGTWCAKLYEHGNYLGWQHEVSETLDESLVEHGKNDKVSSIKVRPGCTFKGYHHSGLNDLMFTVSSDMSFVGIDNNDKMTSFSCECSGKNCFLISLLIHFLS